jgi:hypothetical protein
MYLAFPILFAVLMLSYFTDMIANTPNVWDPSNPKGLSIIFLFWGVVATLFMFFNKFLIRRPLYRNIPNGADVDISTLPGGDDELIVALGEVAPGFEHLSIDSSMDAELV